MLLQGGRFSPVNENSVVRKSLITSVGATLERDLNPTANQAIVYVKNSMNYRTPRDR